MNITSILRSGRLHWVHWLIVMLSVVVTIAAWHISKTQAELKVYQRFEFEVSQLLASVVERMEHYEDASRAAVAAMHLHGTEVNVNSWQRFTKKLALQSRYSGINGIGVVYYVTHDKLNSFVETQRRLRPDFTIHPTQSATEYWPSTYIEPEQSNEQSVGLDMAFEANRLAAAIKARDTGTPQITAPIILVQDAKKTPGFLQFFPFYSSAAETIDERRKYFVGHVYAPFIMNKLINGTLEQDDRQLVFSVFDGSEELYNELMPSSSDFDPKPLYRKQATVDIYGRPWRFNIQTTASFKAGAKNYQSTFILLGGIFIDAMLLFVFYTLSRFYQQANSIAKNMTRKLAASEEYFRHIIDAAPCCIFVMDSAGVIERVNPQAESLFGYSEEEFIGKKIDELVPQRFRAGHPKNRESFARGPSQRRRMGLGREIYALTKSDREFPAEIGLAQFENDDGVKTLATVMDMTEHNLVTSALKRSNKALNDFAYVASHDLKAPLRGIKQLAGWIEEEVGNEVSDEVKEYFTLLNGRVNRLNTLLDDLLAYSRIGKKHGDFKTVDFSLWVHEIYSIFSVPKEYTFKCYTQVETMTTLTVPLELIIRNLINNAIKHHDKIDGCITVTCRLKGKDYFQISVTDTGPGIALEQQERVFEIFQTLKPRDQVEGSGMGLAIVKRTLETYQGSISLESDGKSGSCFTFLWPFEAKLRGILSGRE